MTAKERYKKWTQNHPGKHTEQSRRWNKNNPERKREIVWKWLGVRNADRSEFKWKDYLNLLSYSGNKCDICGTSTSGKKSWCVDHFHGEKGIGPARGILCFECNRLLGTAKDNPKILESAIQYLRKKTGQLELKLGEKNAKPT